MANEQVNLELVLSANLQNFSSQLDSLANRKIDIPIRFTSDANALSADLAKTRREAQLVVDGSKALTSNLKGQRDLLQSQAFELKQIGINAKQNLQKSGQTAAFYQQQLKALDGATAAIKNNRSQYESVNAKILEAAKTTAAFKDRLKELGEQTKASVKQQTEGFFDSLLGKLTLGGVLVEGFKQILQGLGDFFQRGIAFEQLQLGLQAFTGSVDEADKAYESFKQTALETPFDVAGVAQAGKTMLAFGLDTETALDATRRLAIIAGATGSDLNNLARNLGQISAQGRAYTRDLNQFATAGIPIYQKLAEVLEVSVQDVRKFAEEGQIGFAAVQVAIIAMTTAGTAFSSLAAKQLNTVAGQIGNLSTSFTELSGAFITAFGPTIVSALKGVSVVIDGLSGNLGALINLILGVVTVVLGGRLLSVLAAARAGFTAFSSVLGNVGLALKNLNVQQAVQAINALVAQFKILQVTATATISTIAVFALNVAIATAAWQLFNDIVDSYKPSEAIKIDSDNAKQFGQEIDKLATKIGLLPPKAQVASTGLESLDRVVAASSKRVTILGADITETAALFGLAGKDFIKTGTDLRKAETDVEEYRKATSLQAAETQRLIALNKTYATSQKVTADGARELQTVAAARVLSLQAENNQLTSFLPAQKAAAAAAGEQGRISRELLAITESRIAQNQQDITALKGTEQQLKSLTGVEALLNQVRSNPTTENRTEATKALNEQLSTSTKLISALLTEQERLAQAPVTQLQQQLRGITFEYDLQISKLDVILGKYNSVISAINAKIALETRQEYGAENREADLLDKQIVLTEQLTQARERLRSASTAGESAAARIEIRNIQLQQIETRKQIENFDKLEQAQDRVAQAGADKAEAEAESASAASDTLTALGQQEAATRLILDNIQRQKDAMTEVKNAADIASAAIESGLQASLEGAFQAAQNTRLELEKIQRTPVPGKFAGGPVSGGSTYTVNEFGKEAFLSASGRLSMINTPSWGRWTAPSSGTIIPAHLTRQLNIPAGGINLNNPRIAGANRRISSVNGGSTRLDGALQQLSNTQQSQAQQLGKLSRAIDAMRDKDWKVDVNIHGNNPLLNTLRRR